MSELIHTTSWARGPITQEEPEQLNELVYWGYLYESFAPRLEKKGFGKAELQKVLVDNPSRRTSAIALPKYCKGIFTRSRGRPGGPKLANASVA